MATIKPYETASGKRYRVRYRTPDHRQTDKRGFKTKKEAEAFAVTVEVSKLQGEYVAPSAGRVTVRELGTKRLAHRKSTLKPSTWRAEESAWRVHVEPKWGARAVADILPSEVMAWITVLDATLSATSVARAHGVLAGILESAVADRRVVRNVAAKAPLPRKTKRSRNYLTIDQVEALARRAGGERATLVYVLAYTGLRWGEASGLRVRDVNALKRRLRVEENAVMVGGSIEVGTPKTHERRAVPYPEFLEVPIARLCEGKPREGLLFGGGKTHMRPSSSRDGWFTVAVRGCQSVDASFPTVTPHDLRHTAASLAVQSGAHVKAIQKMLGHASAAMTLDTYADLFDDDLDAVSVSLHDARMRAVVGKKWAGAAT